VSDIRTQEPVTVLYLRRDDQSLYFDLIGVFDHYSEAVEASVPFQGQNTVILEMDALPAEPVLVLHVREVEWIVRSLTEDMSICTYSWD